MDKLVSLLVASACIIIAMTLLPLIRIGEWWIRIFDFPRIQIFSLGSAVAIGLVFTIQKSQNQIAKWVLIGLIGSLCFQGYLMYPYTSIASKQSLEIQSDQRASQLSVLVANVYMSNKNFTELLDLVNSTKSRCGVHYRGQPVVGKSPT